MGFTITVANQKGGSAKSTTTVLLAVAAHRAGRDVVVADLDPQQSAAQWAEDAGGLGFDVLPVPGKRARATVERLAAEHAVVVCDTPPAVTDTSIVSAAMAASDLVIVPTPPSRLDVERLVTTLQLADTLAVPAAVLVVRADQRWLSTRELLEALGDAEDIAAFQALIPATQQIVRAAGTVPPVGDLWGYAEVWAEIEPAVRKKEKRNRGTTRR